jgi:hypothetical protein
MTQYKLILGGYGFDGSAHVLTDVEVQKLEDTVQEKGYDSLDDLYSELPELLDKYDYVETNYWATITALASDNLVFYLYDQDENLIWEATYEELTPTFDEDCGFVFPEDADDYSKEIDAYPHEGKENILMVYEIVKGTLISFLVDSEEQPKPSDFSCTVQSLETPRDDYELVDKLFFKGVQLESDGENEDYWSKGLNVVLYTMDHLDSGDDDDDWDDEEE